MWWILYSQATNLLSQLPRHLCDCRRDTYTAFLGEGRCFQDPVLVWVLSVNAPVLQLGGFHI